MPFLEKQIELLNKQLKATALADGRFTAGRIETIAVDCYRRNDDDKQEKFPGIIGKNFEAQEITVDDTYPVVIYHKVLQKGYQVIKDGSVGNQQGYVKETSVVKMVVYSNTKKISMKREELEALITANFPDNFPGSLIAPLKLDMVMAVLQNTNFNTSGLWQEEYTIPLKLAPEDIYFSITYQLQSQWRKGCFKICDCS